MIAFGGAAPLHAGRLCEKLGITRLLVPPARAWAPPSASCAPPSPSRRHVRSICGWTPSTHPTVRALYAALLDEATAFVRSCDAVSPIGASYRVYMRYKGQGWEIPVTIPDALVRNPDAAAFLALFEAEYATLFDRTVKGMAVEATVWTVNASTPVAPPVPVAPPAPRPRPRHTPRALYDASTATLAPRSNAPAPRSPTA